MWSQSVNFQSWVAAITVFPLTSSRYAWWTPLAITRLLFWDWTMTIWKWMIVWLSAFDQISCNCDSPCGGYRLCMSHLFHIILFPVIMYLSIFVPLWVSPTVTGRQGFSSFYNTWCSHNLFINSINPIYGHNNRNLDFAIIINGRYYTLQILFDRFTIVIWLVGRLARSIKSEDYLYTGHSSKLLRLIIRIQKCDLFNVKQ